MITNLPIFLGQVFLTAFLNNLNRAYDLNLMQILHVKLTGIWI